MMNDSTHPAGVIPPDVLKLMQDRVEVLTTAVKNLENTPQVRSLLTIRRALDKEASRLISALDHGSLEGSGFVDPRDLP